ncbi:MAG: winged helix-turn-helix domain-containing protein [Methanoregula sp.]
MRKDEIEERIVRIEKTLRELQAGQKETGETIMAELRSFQSLVIEERIEAMRQQLGQGYQRLLLELVVSTAHSEFETVCPKDCTLYNRSDCIEFFLSRLRESAERMDPDEAEQYIAAQIHRDESLIIRYPELGREPCRSCFDTYVRERDTLMQAVGRLSSVRQVLQRKRTDLSITDLPDEEVISTLIEPLSHPIRFAILKGLSGGNMSYSELSTLTGYKGGHLLFHVTRLVEAGLIVKSGTSGLYTQTEKGMGVMQLVRNLYCT